MKDTTSRLNLSIENSSSAILLPFSQHFEAKFSSFKTRFIASAQPRESFGSISIPKFLDAGSIWRQPDRVIIIGFLIAMIVGHFIAKLVKILPDMVFALAGFAAMAVTLLSMKAVFQITAIGAAREWEGFLSLCVVGALAGYAFSAAKTRFARSAWEPKPIQPL